MSQLLVPDEVYLLCTKGLTKQQLRVISQQSVTMEGGKLVATVKDRMAANCNCACMAIAGAIAGALILGVIAAATIATGGLAVGGISAVGAVGGGLLGALIPCICGMLTSDWEPCHPMVEIENKRIIFDNSVMTCKLGGKIMIFYSKIASDKALRLNRLDTACDVGIIAVSAFGYGFLGMYKGIVALGSGLLEGFTNFGAKVGLKCLGKAGAYIAAGYAGGKVIDLGINQGKGVIGWNNFVNENTVNSNISDIKDINQKDMVSLPDLPNDNYNNRISGYETTHANSYESYRFVDGSSEEVLGKTNTITDIQNGAVLSKNSTTTIDYDAEVRMSDRSGYIEGGTRTETTTGLQYNPLNCKSEIAAGFKESFTKSSILSALGISFLDDMLNMAKKPILKGAIQDYKDSLEAEQEEMNKIMEYEVTI